MLPVHQVGDAADLFLLATMNLGQEYQTAKFLKIEYRTVNAILKKEKALPPSENGYENDSTGGLF